MKSLYFASLLAMVVAGPAFAQAITTPGDVQASPVTTPAKTQTASAAPAKVKMICEDNEELGTRLSHSKVCHTAQEWRDERAHNRMTVDQAQMKGMTGNGH